MSAVDVYLTMPPPKSRWKKAARRIMQAVVRELDDRGRVDPPRDRLLVRIDAAFPFGERARHPYSCWLAERRLLIDMLWPTPKPPAPTIDDVGACEVATDLYAMATDLEGIGKRAEAKAMRDEAHGLLIKQAPRRLNRKCPVCGARPDMLCVDVIGSAPAGIIRNQRMVPHLSRVETVTPTRGDETQTRLL